MSADNVLEIQCPLCKNIHRYELEVHRSFSMSLLTTTGEKGIENKKYFTRLFTCPKKEKEFQARFWMADTSNARIESVEVKGLKKEVADEEG
jgi:hypothetical protein